MPDNIVSVETLDSGSPYRVSYELRIRIARCEKGAGLNEDERESQDYFLDLYLECRHVARHVHRKTEYAA